MYFSEFSSHIFAVGLTGAFGSGKSSARACFAELGIDTGDADGYCHELYRKPAAELREALEQRWGRDVFDAEGALDRNKTAGIVFANPAELAFLTGLVHPLIRERIRREADEAGRRRIPRVIEVPLLFEGAFEKCFDATVAVWTPEALRRARLRSKGFGDGEIARRDSLQNAPDDKLERADFALINAGDRALLRRQCARLARMLFAR